MITVDFSTKLFKRIFCADIRCRICRYSAKICQTGLALTMCSMV